MPKHKFVNSIAHSKELTFYDSKLKMLLLFGLLVFALNKIVRVSMDKKITILQSGGGILDFPASVKIDNATSGQTTPQQQILYITNFGFISASKHLTPRTALLEAGP